MKLDFGCGTRCKEGFEGVDLYAPDAMHKLDLFSFPFPWDDNSVEEINCQHFVEHIPSKIRWQFFDECYRILKPGGKMYILVPNWKSERSYGDMMHEWPPVTSMTFWYLNKAWRDANNLNYGPYDIKSNFDFQAGAMGIANNFSSRSHETQVFATTHYMESYNDMWANLTKK